MLKKEHNTFLFLIPCPSGLAPLKLRESAVRRAYFLLFISPAPSRPSLQSLLSPVTLYPAADLHLQQ